jgi:hypothetical protein
VCNYVAEMFYACDYLHKHNLRVYSSMPLYLVHLLIILNLSLRHRPSVCNVECIHLLALYLSISERCGNVCMEFKNNFKYMENVTPQTCKFTLNR